MRVSQIIQEVTDPVSGSALATFGQQMTDRLTGLVDKIAARTSNVDPSVEKMYALFINGYQKAIQSNPSMRQKLDVYFQQFVKSAFEKSKLGIPAVLTSQNVVKNKLVAKGKINTPYIKSLFKKALQTVPSVSSTNKNKVAV